MKIDTTFLRRCIASLERAVEGIERQEDRDDLMYDIYRAACVKEFELVLEQSYTAHDYGEDFAEATLRLLPDFIRDAKALAATIERANDA